MLTAALMAFEVLLNRIYKWQTIFESVFWEETKKYCQLTAFQPFWLDSINLVPLKFKIIQFILFETFDDRLACYSIQSKHTHLTVLCQLNEVFSVKNGRWHRHQSSLGGTFYIYTFRLINHKYIHSLPLFYSYVNLWNRFYNIYRKIESIFNHHLVLSTFCMISHEFAYFPTGWSFFDIHGIQTAFLLEHQFHLVD